MLCAIFVRSAKIERFAKYFFLLLISLMVGHAAIMRCAIFVWFAKYFFLFLISLLVGHAAIMRGAIFVRFAKIMQSAKFFFSP